MRVLVVNPNTSQRVTRRIREAAEAVARPGDVFTTLCPPYGPELIVTDEDARLARRAVLDTVRGHSALCDGIVLASFGDTAAEEVRALRPGLPVIGIATAAFCVVRALGGPFGIVTFGQALAPGLQAKAEEAGLGAMLLGVSVVPGHDFGDPGTVQERYCAELAELCNNLAGQGAASIVLGGGPLAGLGPRLASGVDVPIIDGTQAAIQILRTCVPLPASPDA